MTNRPASIFGGALARTAVAIAATAFLSVHAAPAATAAAAGPFGYLAGNWSGDGTIKTKAGQKERIRCKIAYTVPSNGQKFDQSMKCASDSYTFEAKSSIAHDAGNVVGTWSMYNLTGNVVGSNTGSKLQAKIRGDGLSINIAVTTNGNNQSVFITSSTTDVTEVSIKLKKGN